MAADCNLLVNWPSTSAFLSHRSKKFVFICRYDPENYFRNPLTVSPRKQQIKTQALGENKWMTDEDLQL